MADDEDLTDDLPEIREAVTDALGNVITGIPAPIRKNFLKAFGQLCTAAVDVPVAMLEGVAAEKRAATKARIKLTSTSAEQLAAQMRINPVYARAASKKFAERVVREQINLDKISEAAAIELQRESASSSDHNQGAAEGQIPEISDDWLNAFEREASQMGSDQMRLLFGKILAGEIRKPSSFSIKTIRLMAQLDGRAASLFRRLCSLSFSLRIRPLPMVLDARVVSPGGNAAANSLAPYGLGFDNLNVLQEYGLIISDYNSYMDYRPAIEGERGVGIPLTYQNTLWGLVPKTPPAQALPELRLHGVALSASGKELLPIVDVDPYEQYGSALQAFLQGIGYTLTPVRRI